MQVSSQYAAALGPFSRPTRVVYPTAAVRTEMSVCARYLREHWRKITVAVMTGVLAGFFAGAVSSREYRGLTQVVYAAGVARNQTPPVATVQQQSALAQQSAAAQATAHDVSRLRAENQQLQALVDELQKGRAPAHTRRVRAHHRRRNAAPA